MDDRTFSQVEAMEPAELTFLAGATSLPCPERQENLRMLRFLDASINRPDTTLSFTPPSTTEDTVEPHHFVVFSVKNVTTKGAVTISELQASKANNSFFTDDPVAVPFDLDEEDLDEIDPEELEALAEPDETEQDDAQLVCKYLKAFAESSAAGGRKTTLSRIHLAIVDGKVPSPELVHSLILQFGLKARLPLGASSSAASPCGVTAVMVCTDFAGGASTSARHPALGTSIVADGLNFLAKQLAPTAAVAVTLLSPGPLVTPSIMTSAKMVPLRRFDSSSTAQLSLALGSSSAGSPNEIFAFAPQASFFPGEEALSTLATVVYQSVVALAVAGDATARCYHELLSTNEALNTTSAGGSAYRRPSCDRTADFSSPITVPGAPENAPLFVELLFGMLAWFRAASSTSGSLPFTSAPVGLLKDDPEARSAVESDMKKQEASLLTAVGGILASADGLLPESVKDVSEILAGIGPKGIALLLRCRITVGSTTAIDKGIVPATRAVLLRSFEIPHEPGQALTVGARALSKHIHRDRTESWWGPGGELKGTQAVKNTLAKSIVQRILDGAVWANVHMLPHDIVALEYRVAEGYGARWTAATAAKDDGSGPSVVEFRGFLEPADPEGHEKGWQH